MDERDKSLETYRRHRELTRLAEQCLDQLRRHLPKRDSHEIGAIVHYWLKQAWDNGAAERASLLSAVAAQKEQIRRLKAQLRGILRRVSDSRREDIERSARDPEFPDESA